ncbi:MAG: hypothetical protein RR306_06555 [Clostridia bacterium]
MELKNIKKKYIIATVLILILATLLFVFAWLLKDDTVKNVGVSNFITNGDVYFMQGTTRTEVTEYIKGGQIKVNTFDTTAPNFVGNLRFDVKQKGLSPCYLRVRLLEQWVDDKTEDIMPGDNIPYDYNTTTSTEKHKWYDNKRNDLCFYYYGSGDGKLNTYDNKTDSTKPQEVIPFLKGTGSYLGVDSGTSLYITFKVETVQPNRLAAFWYIEKLPWEK